MPSAEEKIHEKETVNGVEISVGWDDGYGDYTIYFPQIDISDEVRERGIADQVIRISESAEDAKKVFEYAKGLAERGESIEVIYKKVEEYIQQNFYE